MKIVAAQQAERIVASANTRTPSGMRNAIALRLIYRAGLTPGELSDLRVEHVDLHHHSLQAPGGNRLQARLVGLTADTEDLIRRWLGGTQRPTSEWLLCSISEPTPGTRMDPSYWSRRVREYAERVGIDCTAADLRASWAAACAASGAWTEAELAHAMGQSVESVRQYWRVDPQGIADRMSAAAPQPRLDDAGGPEIRRLRERIETIERQYAQLAEQAEKLRAQAAATDEQVERLTADVRERLDSAHERMDGIAAAQGELHEDIGRMGIVPRERGEG